MLIYNRVNNFSGVERITFLVQGKSGKFFENRYNTLTIAQLPYTCADAVVQYKGIKLCTHISTYVLSISKFG